MKASFLNVISEEYLKNILGREVYKRAHSYYKSGRVHNLQYSNGRLTSWVRGSKSRPYAVNIEADEKNIFDMDCTCFYASDGDICKHIVATLLQWIAQRIQRSTQKRPLPRQKTLFDDDNSMIDIMDTPSSTYSCQQSSTNIFHDIFSGFENFSVTVDLLNNGPQLTLRVSFPHGDNKTELHISPEKSPHIFDLLRKKNYQNVIFSEQASRTIIHKTPLVPHLCADINDQGHIVLSPVLKLQNANKKDQAIPWKQVCNYKINENWIWLNNGYRPVDPIPPALKPYFSAEKPLVYQESDAIDFLKHEFGLLQGESSFIPSAKIKSIKIHENINVSHIEVKATDNDWLWLDPSYKIGKHTFKLSELLASLDNGRYIQKDTDFAEIPKDIKDFWQRRKGIIENGKIKMPKLGYLRTRAELDKTVNVTHCKKTRKFLKDFDRITPLQPGPAVSLYRGTLRNYQQTGYDWLSFLQSNGFNGILADEMGLGKTHQAMVTILSAFKTNPHLPNLIVCPTSVLDHWESKIRSFAPSVNVIKFYGKERNTIFINTPSTIVLTTYSILSRDAEVLGKSPWNYVVLDEAQKIKNHKTRMSKASKELNSLYRLALTGTPIENRLTELWSIFDFLMPGYLGSLHDFKAQFDTPITKYQDTEKRETLKKIIHPFKLRRLKKDVLSELPPKTEEKRYCNLHPSQIVLYKDLINEQGSKLIMKLQDEIKPVEYIHIFAMLTQLKRLCNHPKLLLNGKSPGNASSGKFELFKEIMEETLDSGEKVVVFSQYLEMLDIIGEWLQKGGVEYATLRGNTRNRGKVIDRFQKDPQCNVFLGSLMAGGLGIDLTSASVVIHYDRWWNAAREDQATDRVHRIGQTRGVQVFKLITKGTLEEKIDTMITKKNILMNSIVESDDILYKTFSRKELIELLKF